MTIIYLLNLLIYYLAFFHVYIINWFMYILALYKRFIKWILPYFGNVHGLVGD